MSFSFELFIAKIKDLLTSKLMELLRLVTNETEFPKLQSQSDIRGIVNELKKALESPRYASLRKKLKIENSITLPQKLGSVKLLFNAHAHTEETKWRKLEEWVGNLIYFLEDINDLNLGIGFETEVSMIRLEWDMIEKEGEGINMKKSLSFIPINIGNGPTTDNIVCFDISELDEKQRNQFEFFFKLVYGDDVLEEPIEIIDNMAVVTLKKEHVDNIKQNPFRIKGKEIPLIDYDSSASVRYVICYDISALADNQIQAFEANFDFSFDISPNNIIYEGAIAQVQLNTEEDMNNLLEFGNFKVKGRDVTLHQPTVENIYLILCNMDCISSSYVETAFDSILDLEISATDIYNQQLYLIRSQTKIENDSILIKGNIINILECKYHVVILEDKLDDNKIKILETLVENLTGEDPEMYTLSSDNLFVVTLDSDEHLDQLTTLEVTYEIQRTIPVINGEEMIVPLERIDIDDDGKSIYPPSYSFRLLDIVLKENDDNGFTEESFQDLCFEYGKLTSHINFKTNKHGTSCFVNFLEKESAIKFYYEQKEIGRFTIMEPKFDFIDFSNHPQKVIGIIEKKYDIQKNIPSDFKSWKEINDLLESATECKVQIPKALLKKFTAELKGFGQKNVIISPGRLCTIKNVTNSTNQKNKGKNTTNSPNPKNKGKNTITNSPNQKNKGTNSPNQKKKISNVPNQKNKGTNSPNQKKKISNAPNQKNKGTNSPNQKKKNHGNFKFSPAQSRNIRKLDIQNEFYYYIVYGPEDVKETCIQYFEDIAAEGRKIPHIQPSLAILENPDFKQNIIEIQSKYHNVLISVGKVINILGFSEKEKASATNDINFILSKILILSEIDEIKIHHLRESNFNIILENRFPNVVIYIRKSYIYVTLKDNPEHSDNEIELYAPNLNTVEDFIMKELEKIHVQEVTIPVKFRKPSQERALKVFVNYLKRKFQSISLLVSGKVQITIGIASDQDISELEEDDELSKVTHIFSNMNHTSLKLQFEASEVKYLQQMKHDYINSVYGVSIHVDNVKNIWYLNGFQDLSPVENYIRNYIGKRLKIKSKIKKSKELIDVIKVMYKEDLSTLPCKVLFKREIIELFGIKNNVEKAERKICQWFDDLQIEEFDISSDHKLSRNAANKIKEIIETESNNIVYIIQKNRNQFTYEATIKIYGTDQVSTAKYRFNDYINNLPEPKVVTFKKHIFSKLKQSLLKKDIKDYVKKDLGVFIHWDNSLLSMNIYGLDEETMAEGHEFLKGLSEDMKWVTEHIPFSKIHERVRYFLIYNENARNFFYKKLRPLNINLNVDKDKKVIKLTGPASAISNGKEIFQKHVNEFRSQSKTRSIKNRIWRSLLTNKSVLYGAEKKLDIIVTVRSEDLQNSLSINGKDIQIACTNIVNEITDCIINSCNVSLKHNGGVALSIANSAGVKYIQACKEYISSMGDMREGDMFFSRSGNLSCGKILNVATPYWKGGSEGERDIMENMIINILSKCSDMESITLPLIGCGNFGWPKEEVLNILFRSIAQFYLNQDSQLRCIRIVDIEEKNFFVIKSCLMELSHQINTKGIYSIGNVGRLLKKIKKRVWYWWRYKNDVNNTNNEEGWQRYPDIVQDKLNAAYDADPTSGVDNILGELNEVRNGQKYCVDFISMKQKNMATGVSRDIKHQFEEYEYEYEPQEYIEYHSEFQTDNYDQIRLFLKKDQNTSIVRNQLEQYLNQFIQTQIISVPASQFSVEWLEDLSMKHIVDIRHEKCKSGDVILTISGENLCVTQCKLDISEQIALGISNSPTISYPKDWIEFDDSVAYALYTLATNDSIFTKLEALCRKTMPNINIFSIQRVQSCVLYDAFYLEMKQVEKKLGGDANIHYMFHGTRGTDPSLILQNGFDFRYANCGMWGKGTYFAVNASYSNSYASLITTDGIEYKQFYIAKVIVGIPYNCPPDSSLKHPPVNPLFTGKYQGTHYDSVTGHTNGSDVCIVYANQKAYPAYLVTYREQ